MTDVPPLLDTSDPNASANDVTLPDAAASDATEAKNQKTEEAESSKDKNGNGSGGDGNGSEKNAKETKASSAESDEAANAVVGEKSQQNPDSDEEEPDSSEQNPGSNDDGESDDGPEEEDGESDDDDEEDEALNALKRDLRRALDAATEEGIPHFTLLEDVAPPHFVLENGNGDAIPLPLTALPSREVQEKASVESVSLLAALDQVAKRRLKLDFSIDRHGGVQFSGCIWGEVVSSSSAPEKASSAPEKASEKESTRRRTPFGESYGCHAKNPLASILVIPPSLAADASVIIETAAEEEGEHVTNKIALRNPRRESNVIWAYGEGQWAIESASPMVGVAFSVFPHFLDRGTFLMNEDFSLGSDIKEVIPRVCQNPADPGSPRVFAWFLQGLYPSGFSSTAGNVDPDDRRLITNLQNVPLCMLATAEVVYTQTFRQEGQYYEDKCEYISRTKHGCGFGAYGAPGPTWEEEEEVSEEEHERYSFEASSIRGLGKNSKEAQTFFARSLSGMTVCEDVVNFDEADDVKWSKETRTSGDYDGPEYAYEGIEQDIERDVFYRQRKTVLLITQLDFHFCIMNSLPGAIVKNHYDTDTLKRAIEVYLAGGAPATPEDIWSAVLQKQAEPSLFLKLRCQCLDSEAGQQALLDFVQHWGVKLYLDAFSAEESARKMETQLFLLRRGVNLPPDIAAALLKDAGAGQNSAVRARKEHIFQFISELHRTGINWSDPICADAMTAFFAGFSTWADTRYVGDVLLYAYLTGVAIPFSSLDIVMRLYASAVSSEPRTLPEHGENIGAICAFADRFSYDWETQWAPALLDEPLKLENTGQKGYLANFFGSAAIVSRDKTYVDVFLRKCLARVKAVLQAGSSVEQVHGILEMMHTLDCSRRTVHHYTVQIDESRFRDLRKRLAEDLRNAFESVCFAELRRRFVELVQETSLDELVLHCDFLRNSCGYSWSVFLSFLGDDAVGESIATRVKKSASIPDFLACLDRVAALAGEEQLSSERISTWSKKNDVRAHLIDLISHVREQGFQVTKVCQDLLQAGNMLWPNRSEDLVKEDFDATMSSALDALLQVFPMLPPDAFAFDEVRQERDAMEGAFESSFLNHDVHLSYLENMCSLAIAAHRQACASMSGGQKQKRDLISFGEMLCSLAKDLDAHAPRFLEVHAKLVSYMEDFLDTGRPVDEFASSELSYTASHTSRTITERYSERVPGPRGGRGKRVDRTCTKTLSFDPIVSEGDLLKFLWDVGRTSLSFTVSEPRYGEHRVCPDDAKRDVESACLRYDASSDSGGVSKTSICPFIAEVKRSSSGVGSYYSYGGNGESTLCVTKCQAATVLAEKRADLVAASKHREEMKKVVALLQVSCDGVHQSKRRKIDKSAEAEVTGIGGAGQA